MSRPLGGYIGYDAEPTTDAAPGIWTLREAEFYQRKAQWPGGPADPFFANVSLLLHADGSLTDSSGSPKTVTAVGGAAATGSAKFGSNSFTFDGNGDRLSVPYSSDFNFSGDFTVELWAYLNELKDFQDLISVNTNDGWAQCTIICLADGAVYLLTAEGPITFMSTATTPSGVISSGEWTHVAATRNGSTYTLYINGVSKLTYTNASPLHNFFGETFIGSSSNNPPRFYNGLIDEIRITNGVARYTSNFTPPTAPFLNY